MPPTEEEPAFAFITNRINNYIRSVATADNAAIAKAVIRDFNISKMVADHYTLDDVVAEIDLDDIASKVDVQSIVERVQEELDPNDLVDYDKIDLDYSELASNLDYSDLAGEIDTSNIASEVEVDAEEVAEHLDYKRLALALLDAVRACT